MMQRDPTKWIISLGFSAVLTLMFIVTYISLSQMDENIDQMSDLIQETHKKNTATHNMRKLIRNRGEILDSMYLTEDYFERDLLLLKFADLAIKYKDERNLLKFYELSPAEMRIINKLNPLIEQAKIIGDEAAYSMLSNESEEEIRRKIIKTQDQRKVILTVLSELTTVQDKLALNTLNNSMRYHESSKGIIIYLTLATFVTGILISLLVIRQSSTKNIAIQYQASHDNLTDLFNRKEFERRLRLIYEDAKQNHAEHALCYMDLDQFKIINDTCGHDAGDQLLVELTRLIQEKIRGHDILGRLGGDEFGLILKNCSLLKAMEITEGLVSIVKKFEFISDNRAFHVGVSIGVVSITDKTSSYASAMSDADVACYAAKDMGRGRVHVHELNDTHIKTMHKELHWVADIQSSIQDNRFRLYAQDITPIHSTEPTTMYEVLLRLQDDEGNMVSPGLYIPAAERFGLMHDVDIWVIKNALRYSKQLNSNNPGRLITLFINLSANSLDDQICDIIIKTLDELQLPKGSICFEITETAAMKNIEQANKIITALHAKNVQFALDDFGSGMSSFAYLKSLNVDYLKIDGSFVQNMAVNKVDKAMVAAMKEIGNVMRIQTIAEHVENETTLDRLKELGVDYAQGYHLSTPHPIEDLIGKINDTNNKAAIHAAS